MSLEPQYIIDGCPSNFSTMINDKVTFSQHKNSPSVHYNALLGGPVKHQKAATIYQ